MLLTFDVLGDSIETCQSKINVPIYFGFSFLFRIPLFYALLQSPASSSISKASSFSDICITDLAHNKKFNVKSFLM